MKQALILGCSHASGHEMHLEPNLDTHPYIRHAYGYANSYPVIIAEMLGYTPDNRALPGGSNDAMFRIWNEVKDTLNQTDIVIACWTGIDRTEVWDKKSNKWLPICPGRPTDIHDAEYQNYSKQWITYHTHIPNGSYNKIKNILALNVMAKNLGITVINIDSFWMINEIYNQCNWPVNTNFVKWAQRNNYPHTNSLHFFRPAHQAFAELVVKSIV